MPLKLPRQHLVVVMSSRLLAEMSQISNAMFFCCKNIPQLDEKMDWSELFLTIDFHTPWKVYEYIHCLEEDCT